MTDLRQAFYSNLRPGRYEFELQTANANGQWKQDAASLAFVIEPYLWERKAVQWGLLACLAVGSVAVHWIRLSIQHRRHEARRLQALAAERGRIAADMHDDVGATLTQISMLAELARVRAVRTPEVRTFLERIADGARELTLRISDLVWATSPDNDSLGDLVAYVREHVASAFEQTGVALKLDMPDPVPEHRVSALFRRNLLLAVKEAVQNILKHSGAGNVEMRLTISGGCLGVIVREDGVGFRPQSPGTGGNGLGNMRRRIIELGGRMNLESVPGSGTILEFLVPL